MCNRKISTLVVAAVVTTTLASSMAQAQIRYVDDDAPLAGDGVTWQSAYRFLQDALISAPPGTEIRVGQGTYKPDQDEAGNVTPGDRTETFQLITGVTLRGGYRGAFDGTGLPPDDRDVALFETILSGDLLGDDGPNFANNGENSFNVTTSSGTNQTAVLDGFTITGGNANSTLDGGGMKIFMNGSPTIVTNCTFSENSGGGMKIFVNSSPTIVTNCTFSGNLADFGAGIENVFATLTLTNCTFSGNSAGHGGGLRNAFNGIATLTNCTFSGNSAEAGGGISRSSTRSVSDSSAHHSGPDAGG